MNEVATTNNNLPSSLDELSAYVLINRQRLAQVKQEVKTIKKLDTAQGVYKQKLAEAQQIAEMVTLAEIKTGELLNEIPKAKENQYTKVQIATNGERQNTEVLSPKPKAEVIREMGFSQKQVERMQTMAKHPDIAKRAFEVAKANDDIVSRSLVLNMIKQEQKEEKRAERAAIIEKQIADGSHNIDIYATAKKYRVIYADPPWQYGDKQNIDGLGGAEKHYPTMPLDDICELPVDKITEDDAVLFLWVTSPMLEDAFKVIKCWGFKYKASFVWDKMLHNMGHYNSVRHEFLLVATKGSCTPDKKKLFDSVVDIERGEHSEKPVFFEYIIETLYTHGNKIELFARKNTEGWDAWGNMV